MTEQEQTVAEAPGEQDARDQAAVAAHRLASERGAVSATHNESGNVQIGTHDTGNRNFVTSPPGQQPVLASGAAETGDGDGPLPEIAPAAEQADHAQGEGGGSTENRMAEDAGKSQA